METVVWSYGDKFERTKKEDKPILNNKNEIIKNVPYRGEYNIRKRERNNQKDSEIMEREMIVQTYQNPFFNKNYNDVLDDQERYLKPRNSSIINEK